MQCSTLNLIAFITQVEVLLHGTMQPASRIPGRETGMPSLDYRHFGLCMVSDAAEEYHVLHCTSLQLFGSGVVKVTTAVRETLGT
jgi:hypothetical protein